MKTNHQNDLLKDAYFLNCQPKTEEIEKNQIENKPHTLISFTNLEDANAKRISLEGFTFNQNSLIQKFSFEERETMLKLPCFSIHQSTLDSNTSSKNPGIQKVKSSNFNNLFETESKGFSDKQLLEQKISESFEIAFDSKLKEFIQTPKKKLNFKELLEEKEISNCSIDKIGRVPKKKSLDFFENISGIINKKNEDANLSKNMKNDFLKNFSANDLEEVENLDFKKNFKKLFNFVNTNADKKINSNFNKINKIKHKMSFLSESEDDDNFVQLSTFNKNKNFMKREKSSNSTFMSLKSIPKKSLNKNNSEKIPLPTLPSLPSSSKNITLSKSYRNIEKSDTESPADVKDFGKYVYCKKSLF